MSAVGFVVSDMLQLALLKSSHNAAPVKEEEKGLTEAEVNTLDTIMQGLGIDSEGENDVNEDVDLDAIANAIDTDSEDIDMTGVETKDFSAEFGVWDVC